jgi:hypothetical protein
MKMRSRLKVGITALLAVLFAGSQARATEPTVGIVGESPVKTSLRIEGRAPSFGFYDGSGNYVRFDKVRGDVTILAFTSASKPGVCSMADSLENLAQCYSNWEIKVRYVNVTEPVGGKCDLNSNIVQECGLKSDRVIGLCDEGGELKNLYLADKPNVYFIIDYDGNIAGMGDLSDLATLKKVLAETANHAVSRKRFWDFGPGY